MSSGFWANKVGRTPPPSPVPPSPVSPTPWWQNQQATPAPPQALPVQPTQRVPHQDAGEQHFGDLIMQEEYTTTKAKSALDTERCPDCDSPNYMRPSTSPNAIKQCFNCGYNPRFLHTTHGASGIGQSDLPTRTARAQTLSTNNFNPQQIVGKVSTV